jgi:hypothetical protein
VGGHGKQIKVDERHWADAADDLKAATIRAALVNYFHKK